MYNSISIIITNIITIIITSIIIINIIMVVSLLLSYSSAPTISWLS